MTIVGTVESLWPYPVKSMRGEEISEAFLGSGGVRGDRRWAFHYSKAPETFPYWTARQEPEMLQYQARFGEHDGERDTVTVETLSGEVLAIEDARLIAEISRARPEGESVKLLSSERAMTDCHPLSLFSLQTLQQLSEELGTDIDKRRFRANLYVDLDSNTGFGEDHFVGQKLQIGSTAVVEIIERDPRCKVITLDPETSRADPNVIKQVARAHEGKAGVYGAVLVEGIVKTGDSIAILL